MVLEEHAKRKCDTKGEADLVRWKMIEDGRAEEPFIVRQVRRLELALLKRWLSESLKPVDHILVSDVTQFVKDPSDL